MKPTKEQLEQALESINIWLKHRIPLDNQSAITIRQALQEALAYNSKYGGVIIIDDPKARQHLQKIIKENRNGH